jgi:hypothetical protein
VRRGSRIEINELNWLGNRRRIAFRHRALGFDDVVICRDGVAMLSDTCETYQSEVERLDPGEQDYAGRLNILTQKLAKDATAEIVNFPYGEPAALVSLCAQLVQWLKAEAEDPEDRQRRYARQQAVLDLLTFCHALSIHYGASAARQRENLAEHRTRIADALRPLVP